ncbi:E3 ubiquitin-protein ligase [Platanthera guangdongensis]|uniref:RING-type E3 ubiquitin transferase n=1 Tax=Platanthera guangdongensis TaxID=2320717 RepID=A0ABR2MZ25_9ASPA
MGGLCSCFRGADDEEQEHVDSAESASGHGTSNCFQFLTAQHNILFQRGHVHPVSSTNHGRASVFSSSTDDSSISDTYRPPPPPLPYDDPRCSLVLTQFRTSASTLEEFKKFDFDASSKKKLSGSSIELPPKKTGDVTYIFPQDEDEDVCPTCLEEYTLENPKIQLLCSHHFHLSCIYEWMERSDKCPFCGKVMLFTETQ